MIFLVILRALARSISCIKRSFAYAQDDRQLSCGGSLCKDDAVLEIFGEISYITPELHLTFCKKTLK